MAVTHMNSQQVWLLSQDRINRVKNSCTHQGGAPDAPLQAEELMVADGF